MLDAPESNQRAIEAGRGEQVQDMRVMKAGAGSCGSLEA